MMNIKTAVKILEQITKNPYRRTTSGWLGLCPVHKDSNASLAVTDFNGLVVYHCFAGCAWQDIKKAVETKTCFYDPSEIVVDSRPPWEKTPVAIYDYRDERGRLLFQKLRFEDKQFALRRPHGKGWRWSLGGVTPVIYNLPRVRKAKTVAVVEGEKDADNITKLGIVGTTNYDGAYSGKWLLAYNKYLENKHVLVFADNDAPGIAHARYIYDSLDEKRVLSKTWMHPLPGLSYKQDISDWILMGHTLADLRELWLKRG